MVSPLIKIKDWYKSLPTDHSTDIAALIGFSCPGFDEIGLTIDPENILKIFTKKIDSCPPDRMKEIGMALLLRSAIEFFIINKRSRIEKWEETEFQMKEFASKNDSKTLSHLAKKMEFRGKQWIVTCGKWNDIRSKYLSDSYFDSYLNINAT